jgi:hypothetical protein
MGDGVLILAYDGSGPAKAAISDVARLFPGYEAVVVTGWSSIASAAQATRIALPDDIIRGGDRESRSSVAGNRSRHGARGRSAGA